MENLDNKQSGVYQFFSYMVQKLISDFTPSGV
jgi:hypothetical protein